MTFSRLIIGSAQQYVMGTMNRVNSVATTSRKEAMRLVFGAADHGGGRGSTERTVEIPPRWRTFHRDAPNARCTYRAAELSQTVYLQ